VKNQKLIYNDIIKGYSEIHLEKYGKVYFKHLTVEDSAGLEDTTDFYKSKAEGLGLPSEKEQLKILNEQGIWTDEEEQRRAELSSFVDGLRNSRKKLFLQKQLAGIDNQLNEAQDKLKDLETSKAESIGLTSERYAQKKSSEHYIRSVLYKDNQFKEKVISIEEFDHLTELDLNKLFEGYMEISKMFDDNSIKRISLAPFFLSIFYICGDDVVNLFGKPVIKLTFNQTNLFTYARYYKQMISDAKVKPPEDLYKDPDKLVDWLESAKEGQKAMEKALPEEGKAGAVSMVGATKEDLAKMGIDSGDPQTRMNLTKEAQKKGGTLDMEDFIRLHG